MKRITWESKARKLKSAGATYEEIALEVGVSRQRVQQVLRISGIPREGICDECKNWNNVLHCHHTNYTTNEFQVLCPSCHIKKHPKKSIDLQCTAHKMKHGANEKRGASVRKAREDKGMSLRKLAHLMGITPPFLSDLELGRRNWTQDRFDLAIRILGGDA